MIPTDVPSDLDVDRENYDALTGRWTILVDLHSEFQGAVGAYALFGLLLPGVLVASIALQWVESGKEIWTWLAAVALFIGCAAISGYSLVWLLWVRKRMKRVEALMEDRRNDDPERFR